MKRTIRGLTANFYRRFIVLGITGAFLILSAKGQIQTQYTTDDGLASNNVYYIYPDSKGFLWFGTDRGVSRFDGRTFINYNTSDGLINDDVFIIKEDSIGRIWFGTYASGLCFYENDSIFHFKYNAELFEKFSDKSVKLSIHFDKSGNILLGDNLYNLIKIDSLGQIEILGRNKRNVFQFGNEIVTSTHRARQKRENFVSNLNQLSFYKNDKLELSFSEKNKSTELFHSTGSHYAIEIGKDTLALIFGNHFYIKHNSELKESKLPFHVDCIFQDQLKRLWLGSRKKGLFIYKDHTLDEQLHHFLNGMTITHVSKDFQGGYWCSTLNNGVYHFTDIKNENKILKKLPEERVLELQNGPSNSVFVLFQNGDVWRYDGAKAEQVVRYDDLKNKEANTLFYHDSSKTLFSKYDEIITYSKEYSIREILKFKQVTPKSSSHILHVLPNGEIFDFRGRGIYGQLDDSYQIKIFMESEYNKAKCSHYFNDTLWIGTLNGLYFINDTSFDNFEVPVITGFGVKSITSWKNKMAVAVDGKGILIREKGRKNVLLSVKDGFANLNFNDIVYDNKGKLYVAVADGMYRIVQSESIVVDKISVQQTGINPLASVLLAVDNQLYLGTEHGLEMLTINELETFVIPPISVIKIAEINGIHAHHLNKNQLKHNENSLGIEFTSIGYTDVEGTIFAWRMNKPNENWHYTKNSSLYLDRLKHGEYEIEVKSSVLPNVWSLPASVEFTILPPFYLTWYFILLEAIALLFSVTGIVAWRSSIEKRKAKKEIELTRERADLEMRALRAQMNPHFIFNTLTSIQYLINSKQNDRAEYFLEKFSRLLRLVVDKSEESMVSLMDELDILRIYVDLENLRFDDKFDFHVNMEDSLDLERIRIPGMILQPFVENAIEHGLSKKEGRGELSIDILKENGMLELSIKDDGIGRDKSKEIKEKSKKKHRSVGISNVTRRVDLLNNEENLKKGNIEIIDLYDDKNQSIGTNVRIHIKYIES